MQPKSRDYNALAACLRTGGPMKDRRDPRGGAKNLQNAYLEEYWNEFVDLKVIVADVCISKKCNSCSCD